MKIITSVFFKADRDYYALSVTKTIFNIAIYRITFKLVKALSGPHGLQITKYPKIKSFCDQDVTLIKKNRVR